MDADNLHSFLTVVDQGSFAEAARTLDLTPSAVAARVRALEDELGISLVQRAGRVVRPTEAGASIVERVRSVLREMRDLRSVATGGGEVGELRLGGFVSAMTSMLPAVLKGLYPAHPDLKVFVAPGHSVDLCRKVNAGELDAAFVVEPQFSLGKNCKWFCLVQEPLVVVAPKALAHIDPLTLLRTQPYIRYDRTVLGGQLADRYLRDHDIRPRQRLEIDGLGAVASLVGEGLGVALIPDWAPLWNSNLDIAKIELPDRTPVRKVGLAVGLRGPRIALVNLVLQQAQRVFNAHS